jgi:heptaprenyl diphosphate synthase
LTELSLLTAVALIIFVIELRIPNPVPIPGVKLGLANIITVFAVYRYNAKEVAAIVITRILLGSFFSGNVIALLYSLSGGLLCLSGMLILRRMITTQYIWVCSVLGAVLHNIGQILVAVIIAGTWSIAVYLPFLLVSGCIAGAFTGFCAQIIVKRNLQF